MFFYNDSSGNMYCGLSRQSNYKQVIFDSADKRPQLDISSSAIDYISLNKFNPPIYGGTYTEEQMRIPPNRNDKNFYVFNYITVFIIVWQKKNGYTLMKYNLKFI